MRSARFVTTVFAVLALAGVAESQAPRSTVPRSAATPEGRDVAPRAIPITVGRAEARGVQRTVETSGSLLAADEVQAKAEQSGTIARLFADLGDRVTAGSTLAEYDNREFRLAVDQARADLSAAREALARAEATTAASEASLRRVRDSLGTLEADVVRAQSQVDWARAEMTRAEQLFAKELVAAREVDSARNQITTSEAQLTIARTALAQHPDQVRVAEAQLRSDTAAVRAAEALVRQREAALGIVEKRLGDTTVRAPITGVISRRHVSAGEFVKDSTPIFTVVVPHPLKYVGTVPERRAPELKTGQTVRLTVEAYTGRAFTGTVVRLAPAVDVATRTLAVEARVPNADGSLRPGFFAKGEVLTRQDSSVVVPAEALMVIAGLAKVFVVNEGKSEERLVKVGGRQGAIVEILDGVRSGETVATSNLPSLYNGASVTVTAARPPKQ